MKPKILLVDEDPAIQKSVTTILRKNGFLPFVAADGMTAVHEARVQEPDLILINIGLPGGGGITTLHRIRQLSSLVATPIMMFSNHEDLATVEKAMAEGADKFLRKDVPEEELLEAIRELL